MIKRLTIEGRVQGVGYRAFFAGKAIALGLAGWVRNRRDGSVEACVAGDAAMLDAIIQWSRRGPPTAKVSNVLIEDVTEPVELGGTFKILHAD